MCRNAAAEVTSCRALPVEATARACSARNASSCAAPSGSPEPPGSCGRLSCLRYAPEMSENSGSCSSPVSPGAASAAGKPVEYADGSHTAPGLNASSASNGVMTGACGGDPRCDGERQPLVPFPGKQGVSKKGGTRYSLESSRTVSGHAMSTKTSHSGKFASFAGLGLPTRNV